MASCQGIFKEENTKVPVLSKNLFCVTGKLRRMCTPCIKLVRNLLKWNEKWTHGIPIGMKGALIVKILETNLMSEKFRQFVALRLDTWVAERLCLLYKSGVAGKDDNKDCLVDVLSRCDPCKKLCCWRSTHLWIFKEGRISIIWHLAINYLKNKASLSCLVVPHICGETRNINLK